MKKISSLILVLMLVLAMAVPAMAAMEGALEDGSITITNPVSGQVYNAYQILYLESYDATDNTYAYKANSAWAGWIEDQTDYVSVDDQGYVTWVEGAKAADFAEAAQSQLAGKVADKSVTAAEGATSVVLDGLKLGYYLVDTTLGTLCSLDTTNPDVEMEEKNEAPEVTKEVKEDSDGDWGETNDADVNQTVEYKATITVKKGAENYILHDTMSVGLTYVGVTAVKINDTTVASENYDVSTDTTDGCTFEVRFNNDYIADLEENTEIVVEYSATLNDKAVVGLPGNPNEVKLQYGDENHPSYTPKDETITYTWDMGVLKYANGDETKVLEGVKFILLNKDKTKVASIVDGKFDGWNDFVAAEDATEENPATVLTGYELSTGAGGKIAIEGLDADTYYLRETAALAGYNKLAEDVEVVVNAATTDDEDADEDGNTTELRYSTVVAKVNNESGTELPSTGGMGTTILYVGGGLLIAAALILLVAKKRTAASK